jgi:hypothetical protein
MPPSAFEIKRTSPRRNVSLITPSGTTYPRGTAFQESDTLGTAELADSTKAQVYFATREIKNGGPTLSDDVFPGRLESPATAGDEASFEDAEVIEAEGGDYIATGTGAITSATAVDTEVALTGGKFRAAQSGEYVWGLLKSASLTPEDSGNAVRISVEKITSYKKA